VAIVGRARDHARLVEIHQRVQLLCFFFGDDIELEADIFRAAFEVLEPFLFDPGETLADTSCLVKYRFLAGFLRQDFVVELDRVATVWLPMKFEHRPAACQVEPLVSSPFSTSTTSLQPSLVRW
jgi:hypothetical protein